ncbi:hypothetical protein EPUS_09175 [Endocarpon pusillum Z07020]|uniref:Uncharacterized protein n=1 Tax=Endocarpon pusillum (strain Z07020 / HMAS-L-300199) TaxID=1263415 RepID=U1I3E0_ENDPU|nr:uncharacterized protein EPUS_09175 [Endocarpon pusillum Z07020]ERF76539.1 hypothetical protein EPUS_09175 [Endocarpon pusillum Z07020]
MASELSSEDPLIALTEEQVNAPLGDVFQVPNKSPWEEEREAVLIAARIRRERGGQRSEQEEQARPSGEPVPPSRGRSRSRPSPEERAADQPRGHSQRPRPADARAGAGAGAGAGPSRGARSGRSTGRSPQNPPTGHRDAQSSQRSHARDTGAGPTGRTQEQMVADRGRAPAGEIRAVSPSARPSPGSEAGVSSAGPVQGPPPALGTSAPSPLAHLPEIVSAAYHEGPPGGFGKGIWWHFDGESWSKAKVGKLLPRPPRATQPSRRSREEMNVRRQMADERVAGLSQVPETGKPITRTLSKANLREFDAQHGLEPGRSRSKKSAASSQTSGAGGIMRAGVRPETRKRLSVEHSRRSMDSLVSRPEGSFTSAPGAGGGISRPGLRESLDRGRASRVGSMTGSLPRSRRGFPDPSAESGRSTPASGPSSSAGSRSGSFPGHWPPHAHRTNPNLQEGLHTVYSDALDALGMSLSSPGPPAPGPLQRLFSEAERSAGSGTEPLARTSSGPSTETAAEPLTRTSTGPSTGRAAEPLARTSTGPSTGPGAASSLQSASEPLFHENEDRGMADDGRRDLDRYRSEARAYVNLKKSGLCDRGIVPKLYGFIESFDPKNFERVLHSFLRDKHCPNAILLEYLPGAS